ncbi:Hsp20/alpha crystallin family protein [Natrononativus amylolyticus]|uniref:Hsp20/alpha crystallin family protein n=1 Tax=Natrononativus amylolyticus TaxID=2963434 RepID=UPI0020CF502D|nr:Hsp20/alpha crystallin family protein [Natrononativus amylolyticus]
MTNDPPTDDGDDRPADRTGEGPRSWLSTVLTALDRLDQGRRTGRADVDYSVSLRSGLEDLIDREHRRDSPAGRTPSRPDRTRSRRLSRQREHVSTRTYDDELLVTAELAGVDPEDVTVGFDGDALVIGVEGRELERVSVPWRDRSASATVHNDVLTVTVTPDSHE